MSQVKEDSTIRGLIKVLYNIGFWPSSLTESPFRKYCKQIPNHYHMEQLIYLLEFELFVCVDHMLLTYFLLGRKKILKFLYDHNVTHQKANRDEAAFVNCENRKIGLINQFYFLYLFAIIFILHLISLPIFTGKNNILPLFIRFNVDSNYERVLYWIAYIHSSLTYLFGGIFSLSIVIIWYIFLNYSIEYKLLGQRLRSLGTATAKTYQNDLIRLVKDHQELYR